MANIRGRGTWGKGRSEDMVTDAIGNRDDEQFQELICISWGYCSRALIDHMVWP